jgi:hypothetical protein
MNSSEDYMPAYRRDESGDVFLVYQSATVKIGNVAYIPDLAALKGSTDKILPFPESAIMNTKAIIQRAVSNLAAKEAAYTLHSLGLGVMESGEAKGKNVIHFRQNGVEKSLVLDFDPKTNENIRKGVDTGDISPDLLVTGLEGVSTNIPALVRMLNPFSRALRYTVTRFPAYAARQLMRDPMAAWLVTGTSFNPVTDTMKRLVKTLRHTDATANKLQSEGALGGLIYEGDNETIKRLMKQFGDGDPNMFSKLMRAADNLAVDADAVTRANVYDAAIADGKTELEAWLAAVESMNFNTHGTSKSLYLLNMTVPFLRAQINGLDAIYKALSGKMSMADKLKTRDMLLTRGGMIAAVTMMYALAVQDEEWYQDATPEQRYGNFLFKLPGVDEPLKLPIPFELGLIFKALPEAMVDQMAGDEGAGDSMRALKELFLNAVPNPVPQGVKPALEVMLNGGFFTDRPIESVSMQRLPKDERAGPRTPEVAKAMAMQFEVLGKHFGLSPAQIEHLTRGYFSSLGIAMMNVVDASLGLGPAGTEKPEKLTSENAFFGSMYNPVRGHNILQKAYEMTEQFAQQAASLKKAQDEGDLEKLEEFASDPKKLIYAEMDSAGRAFKKEMGELRKQEMLIRNMDMTPREKRELIDNLNQIRKLRAQAMFAQSKAVREAIASE